MLVTKLPEARKVLNIKTEVGPPTFLWRLELTHTTRPSGDSLRRGSS